MRLFRFCAVATLVVGAASLTSFNPLAVQADVCTITGTAGDDILTGTEGADIICGKSGNDTINSGAAVTRSTQVQVMTTLMLRTALLLA